MRNLRLRPTSGKAGDVVTVRVITYAPTVFTHCQHCELAFGEIGLGDRIRREEAASALPPDLAVDFEKLADWVGRLVEQHGPRIHVEVIDAASVEGMVASVRWRLWRHPAIVVDREVVNTGADYAAAEPAIARAVARRSATEAAAPTAARGDREAVKSA